MTGAYHRLVPDPALPSLGLRPLSARSVLLSLLLGSHPPEMPARELVAGVARLGIGEAAARVALTRMVAAGDLDRSDATYRLSRRLVERQRRQDLAITPETVDDCGQWDLVVVTTQGRDATDRSDLRRELLGLRLAELREGHWLRPANLPLRWPAAVRVQTTRFRAVPAEPPADLAARLWDLPAWQRRAEALMSAFDDTSDPRVRITVAAAMVRHLLTDPLLPSALQPPGWPADHLRDCYASYRAEVAHLVSTIRG